MLVDATNDNNKAIIYFREQKNVSSNRRNNGRNPEYKSTTTRSNRM